MIETVKFCLACPNEGIGACDAVSCGPFGGLFGRGPIRGPCGP